MRQANRELARSINMAVSADRILQDLQTSRTAIIVRYAYILITLVALSTTPLLANSKGEWKRKTNSVLVMIRHHNNNNSFTLKM